MLKSHSLLRRAHVSAYNCNVSSSSRFRKYTATCGGDEKNGLSKATPDGERYKRGRLFVSASEIANLINLNPHVATGDAVERLWEKNNRRSFTEALARNKLQIFTQEERLKELGLLDLATSVVDAEDANDHEERLKKTLKRATTVQDRRVVRDFVNTSRGIKHEKLTFEILKQKHPSANLETDINLYRKTVTIADTKIEYVISGYIDGVELNHKRIIEIKTRQNRLFNHVPLYEQVQCQAYLFLTGLTICEHTENFRGALQSTTLHYEPVFWNHIIERLNKVMLAVDSLVKDVDLQDAFLKTREVFELKQLKKPLRERTKSSKRSESKSLI
jgi:hypothetical protein